MSLKRLEKVNSFLVMDVMEKAHEMERAGENIIHLEIGEPDFETPAKVREAGMEAIRQGKTHYTHSLGIPSLRRAVCSWYEKKYGVIAEPEQVIITMGTSPGLLLVLSVLASAGDEVILSDPGYACYPNFIHYMQAEPVFIDVHEETGFQYQIEDVKRKISAKTKAIMTNSPSNPTGNLLSPSIMADIAGLGMPIISDEIYHGLVYRGRAHSMLEYTKNTFILNGFSKLFAMTGWRLGYLIVPPEYVRTIQKLQQNFFISPTEFVQYAGVVALTEEHPELDYMRRTYDQRRQEMIRLLREIGFGVTVEPTGAFYVFANARKYCTDSLQFAFEILQKAKVAVAPGIDFGSNGEGYLRFSYANSLENIREGMRRLKSFLHGK